jgi:hypothetical protein
MVSTLLPPFDSVDSTRIMPSVKRGLRTHFHRHTRLFFHALAWPNIAVLCNEGALGKCRANPAESWPILFTCRYSGVPFVARSVPMTMYRQSSLMSGIALQSLVATA